MNKERAFALAMTDPNGYSPESEGHNPMSNMDYYLKISDPNYGRIGRF